MVPLLQPLTNGVVRNSKQASRPTITVLLDELAKLTFGGSGFDLPALRHGDRVRTGLTVGALGTSGVSAFRALSVLPPRERVCLAIAVWTKQPEVLLAVVVRNPVDVIEDHHERTPFPLRPLSAFGATVRKGAILDQSLFQRPAPVSRIPDHDLLQRKPST